MHARYAPLTEPLFVGPSIVRAILAPAIEDTITATRLGSFSIDVDPQPVHVTDLAIVILSTRRHDYRQALLLRQES